MYGAYVQKTSAKAENCGDNMFWMVKWEVQVDRTKRVGSGKKVADRVDRGDRGPQG